MRDEEVMIEPAAGDAVMSAYLAYKRWSTATTMLSQASNLIALANAMSDVASWLPGFNPETGEVEIHDA